MDTTKNRMDTTKTSIPVGTSPKKKKKIIKVIKKVKKIIKVKRKKSPLSSVAKSPSREISETKSVIRRLSPDDQIKMKKKNRLKKVKKHLSEKRSAEKRSSSSPAKKKKKVIKRERKKESDVVKLEEKTKLLKDDSGMLKMQFGEEDRSLGQKYPSPSPGEGMRVFYETLLIQRNDSKIALKWCTEHGIYPVYTPEKAVKMLAKLAKSSTSRSSSSSSSSKKRRKLNTTRNDDDFVVDVGMSVGVWEGQGVRDI